MRELSQGMYFKLCSQSLSCLHPGWRKKTRNTQTEMTAWTELVYIKAPQKALEHRLGEWPASMASGVWDRNKISSSWGRCLGSGRLALWQQENACMSISCGLCPSHPGIPAGRQTAATRHPKWGNNRKWAAALPNILEAVVSEFLRQKIMLQ